MISSEAHAPQPPAAGKRTLAITVTEKGFGPEKLTVKRGEAVVLAFTRRTEKTCARQVILELGGGKKVEKELQTVVEHGHAVTFGELELGLNAVAVPVRGEDGHVIAALSASGPAYRLSPERFPEVLAQLADAAADLSRRMGHWGVESLASAG